MKNFILFLLLVTCFATFSQYTLIPDAAFEQRLIDLNIDSDNTINGHVLTSDVASVTSLNINSSTTNIITDITGIQDFISLTRLLISDADYLSNINLQSNVNLKQLYILCPTYFPTLTSPTINILNNIQLEDFQIDHPRITTLDLSNNINLKKLVISYSNISNLDISNNINLTYCGIGYNYLTSIDLNSNTELDFLDLGHMNISNVDLSTNIKLKNLYIYYLPLQTLNLQNNPLLNFL